MARKPVVFISNVPDFTDCNGLWFAEDCITHGDTFYRYKTRAQTVWSGVRARTKQGSVANTDRPGYNNSKNLFENFQQFAGWCQDQYGYNTKEDNHKFWQLDKDLLIPGNKDYSPAACIFVPNRINNLFKDTTQAKGRNGLPYGVRADTKGCYYGTVKSTFGAYDYKADFSSAIEAHSIWQKMKLWTIEKHMDDKSLGDQIIDALGRWYIRISDDLHNERRTLYSDYAHHSVVND